MKIKVYAVIYRESSNFQCITRDFNKWLMELNKRRKEEGDIPEHKHEFDVFEDIIEV